MRRFALALAVLSSLLIAAQCLGATRPRYGGTLRVNTRAALTSLDPGDPNPADVLMLNNVSRLLFDTLVTLDDKGKPRPSLATSWQAEQGGQRWIFTLRSGVRLQDGSPVMPDIVAAALRSTNPTWKVLASDNAVVIESDSPASDLPGQMALARNSIVKRNGDKLMGTGPFVLASWQPGKKLTLTARDDYWNGRPFLDTIEIDLGRNLREQMIALDLGKVDLIDVDLEQAHRAATDGRRVISSAPIELLALVFQRDRQSDDEGELRRALALIVDRSSLKNVILQGSGEVGGSILPNWLSGYAFLFPAGVELRAARELRDQVGHVPTWTLGYDTGDPVGRLLAERIALNARDAGLVLQPTMSSNTDVRLMRIPISSLDAGIALSNVAARVGTNVPKPGGNSVDDLYQTEKTLLASQRVIPLLHLRVSYALAPAVRWDQPPDGSWRLADVWLGTAKP